jgi:DEAD/DEAH box helicase domain-containing protein
MGARADSTSRRPRVYGQEQPGAYAFVPDPGGVVTTTGQAHRIALLARRRTDVLLARVERWPDGVFADPQTVEGRAAWFSFAFWLRLSAGAYLDVDPQELQAGYRSLSEATSGVARPIGEAFLCDQLENGAGYCRELARDEQFGQLLDQAEVGIGGSIAATWTNAVESVDDPVPHATECDTSCSRCLRDFQNLPYHGLFDWRLALEMARIASSAAAVVDLVSPWSRAANPWTRLVEGGDAPVPKALKGLGYGDRTPFAQLHGYVHPTLQKVLVERHPLWQDDHPLWVAAAGAAMAQHPGFTIFSSNPFRILRRPADGL